MTVRILWVSQFVIFVLYKTCFMNLTTRFSALITILLSLAVYSGHAQATSQLGVSAGPVAFQSDYGARDDFETNSKNVGIGVNLMYFVDWSEGAPRSSRSFGEYLQGHFKVRAEFSYHQTSLEHFGQYAEADNRLGDQLRNLEGQTSVFEFGPSVEWHPRMIRGYNNMSFNFDYWIGFGVRYVSFNPEASTKDGGPLNTALTTPDAFRDRFQTSRDQTTALVVDLGASYRIDRNSDILLVSKWHAYSSNYVDGLSPRGDQNEANDWVWMINVGYRYTFD